jgi:hypothetical protein
MRPQCFNIALHRRFAGHHDATEAGQVVTPVVLRKYHAPHGRDERHECDPLAFAGGQKIAGIELPSIHYAPLGAHHRQRDDRPGSEGRLHANEHRVVHAHSTKDLVAAFYPFEQRAMAVRDAFGVACRAGG